MRRFLAILPALVLGGCGSAASGNGSTATPQSHWSHPPAFTINPAHHYTATLVTSDGSFEIQLLPRVAPLAVNNFVFLARHRFYDGNIFHRIVQGFVIQTGDPTGTGFGGPGYHFRDEKVTMRYVPGTVAMANSGANTNGSQFFVVTGGAAARALRPQYTIFGRVISGMSVVERLDKTPVQPNPGNGELSQPSHDVYLKRVTIQETP